MKTTTAFFLCCSLLLFNCKKEKVYSLISSNAINDTLVKKNKIKLKNWQFKDILLDTIPGISLNRAYDSLLQNKKGQEVIIAVLDSEIDINHTGLKNYIWTNPKEIPNNNIDDDKNGYVDDIHGWNFLGNKKGENESFTSYSFTRVLKKYNPVFKGKKMKDIASKDSLLFSIYKRAQKNYDAKVRSAKGDIEYADMLLESLANVKKILSTYFPTKNYTLKDLDSLKKVYPKDTTVQDAILIRSNFIKYRYSYTFMKNYKLKAEKRVSNLLNLDFNDRKIIGDNPEDISDISYGNNNVNGNLHLFRHGTEVAGSIVNINKNIKLMSLAISPFGEANDKDIAVAIRYAVDNGAKVINMSFLKHFSLHRNWVNDAFKYAEKHHVLIVTAAGNSSKNLNTTNSTFPNDLLNNGTEVTDNFLYIGATLHSMEKKFLPYYSNYGNKHVDIFAPGDDMYTCLPNNEYHFQGGTSLASALTSGVAALIFSYYPNLTASQVKHIIMDSGIEYTVEVKTPTKENKKKTTPFNQLSKSGKVVNAYNALIMAEKISNQ